MRYVLSPSGTESKKSNTSGISIKDAVDLDTSFFADSWLGFKEDGSVAGLLDRMTLLSRLESVSTSGSSGISNDESAFMAFIAVTGDKLGLGKDIS